jgi:hypothetical protein
MSFGMWGVPSPTDPPAPQSFYGMKHAFAKEFIPGTDGSLRTDYMEFPPAVHAIVKTWLRGYMCNRSAEMAKDAMELLMFFEDNPQGVVIWVGDWMDGPHGDTVDPEPEVEVAT